MPKSPVEVRVLYEHIVYVEADVGVEGVDDDDRKRIRHEMLLKLQNDVKRALKGETVDDLVITID